MTNRSFGQIGLPPPTSWNLVDGDRVVGWTADNTVGFRGFGNQTEAVHAAWVAYRALAQRLARTHGARPVPIDVASLAVQRVDGQEWILADGRPIARLIRQDAETPDEPESFGFAVEVPQVTDDLELQALAHLMYRTLRRSGLRWALWRTDARPETTARATEPVNHETAPSSSAGLTTTDVREQRRRKWTLPTSPIARWRRSRVRQPSYAGGTSE